MPEQKLPWKITDEEAFGLIADKRRQMLRHGNPPINLHPDDLLISWLVDKVQEMDQRDKRLRQRLIFASEEE